MFEKNQKIGEWTVLGRLRGGSNGRQDGYEIKHKCGKKRWVYRMRFEREKMAKCEKCAYMEKAQKLRKEKEQELNERLKYKIGEIVDKYWEVTGVERVRRDCRTDAKYIIKCLKNNQTYKIIIGKFNDGYRPYVEDIFNSTVLKYSIDDEIDDWVIIDKKIKQTSGRLYWYYQVEHECGLKKHYLSAHIENGKKLHCSRCNKRSKVNKIEVDKKSPYYLIQSSSWGITNIIQQVRVYG